MKELIDCEILTKSKKEPQIIALTIEVFASKDLGKRANFQTALLATDFGKFNYFLIFTAGTLLGSVLFESGAIIYVLPTSDCDLHLTIDEKGILGAIGALGIISSSYFWALLADRIGRHEIIRSTLLMSVLLSALSSFANDFLSLAILRFSAAFFISGATTTIYSYLVEFHVAESRGKVLMVALVIPSAIMIFFPLVAWLVINHSFRWDVPILGITYKPWRLFIVICGIPAFLCGLCFFFLPESPKFTFRHNRHDETVETLRKMFAINTGRPKHEYPFTDIFEDKDDNSVSQHNSSNSSNSIVNAFKSAWNQTIPIFQKKYLKKTLVTCILQFVAQIIAHGWVLWFPYIFDKVGEFRNAYPNERSQICEIMDSKSVSSNSLNVTVDDSMIYQCKETLESSSFEYSVLLACLYTIFFATFTFLVDKLGIFRLLFLIFFVSGVSGVAIAFANIPILSNYLLVILVLCSLASNALYVAVVKMYPTKLRTVAISASILVGHIGSALGADVWGELFNYNCTGLVLASGLLLIASGFLGLLL